MRYNFIREKEAYMNSLSSNLPLLFCGVFYAVLCVFSIVTGLIYMSGKRELNPLELPDSFVRNLRDPEEKKRFAARMGLLTFVVGIIQGITSYSILAGRSPFFYGIAFGFNLFSIFSVLFKLRGKINAFPLMKLCFYLAILVILLLPGIRALYF